MGTTRSSLAAGTSGAVGRNRADAVPSPARTFGAHIHVARTGDPERKPVAKQKAADASSPRTAAASMAEAEGFEPPEPCGSLVFKTSSFNHSDTLPSLVPNPP